MINKDDAMTNEMNKYPISNEESVQEIKKQSEIKFDPKIVNIFVKLMLGN